MRWSLRNTDFNHWSFFCWLENMSGVIMLWKGLSLQDTAWFGSYYPSIIHDAMGVFLVSSLAFSKKNCYAANSQYACFSPSHHKTPFPMIPLSPVTWLTHFCAPCHWTSNWMQVHLINHSSTFTAHLKGLSVHNDLWQAPPVSNFDELFITVFDILVWLFALWFLVPVFAYPVLYIDQLTSACFWLCPLDCDLDTFTWIS